MGFWVKSLDGIRDMSVRWKMSQKVQVLIDEQGNLLLPAKIQKKIHLSPGMTLVVESSSKGGLRLRAQHEHSTLMAKEGVLVVRAEVWGDLSNVVKKEREQRVFELLRQVQL